MASITRTTALAVALLVCAPASAQVYKWVDEEGVTHYTQQPPPGGKAQIINPNVASPEVPAAASSGANQGSGSGGDSGQAGGGNGGQQSMAEFCKQLREEAQLLASDRQVKVRSGDSVTDLTGDARQQRLQSTRSQIQQYCGDGGS